MKELEVNCFGGSNAEPLNALMSALFRAAGGGDNEKVYDFMGNTPKTSFVVELHDALTELGYQILPLDKM